MKRFIIIFFLILTNSLFAEIKKVTVIGNVRVNTSTIESLVDKKIANVDSIYINNLTKKIYDTDFFSDVKISFNQDVLSINVVENPIVNFFYINGIKDTDLDQVNKIITLKENTIFSSAKLKKDIEATKEFLNASGYYQASINPEVIKVDNNQVNLIINIDKKEISKIKNIYFIGNKFFSFKSSKSIYEFNPSFFNCSLGLFIDNLTLLLIPLFYFSKILIYTKSTGSSGSSSSP